MWSSSVKQTAWNNPLPSIHHSLFFIRYFVNKINWHWLGEKRFPFSPNNAEIRVDPSWFHLFDTVFGLRCYNCASSESFDDCSENEKVDCTSGFDRCYRGEIFYDINSQTVKTYGKGCTTAAQCTDQNDLMCKNIKSSGVKNVKCHMKCCTEDLCNSSAGVQVSILILFTCVVFGLGYLRN